MNKQGLYGNHKGSHQSPSNPPTIILKRIEKIKNRLIGIIDKVEKNSGLDYNKESNSQNLLDEKLLLKNQRELLLKANKILEKVVIHLKKTK